MNVKTLLYIAAVGIVVVGTMLTLRRDLATAQRNDAAARVVFEQGRLGVQEIPSDDVHVVYFRDSAAGLCYALLAGRVLLKPGWSRGFGNIVVVPCDKALWSQMDSVP